MRYKDYNDSANDNCYIVIYSTEAVRKKQQMTDDYELLENYDFISHLESSGLLREYREASCEKEMAEDIHINLDFMETPFFYQEVEYFDKLNMTLEKELVELDDKLTTPPFEQTSVIRKSKKRTWKVQLSMAIYSLLATAILLGGFFMISGSFNTKEDAYALDYVNKPPKFNKPDVVKNVAAAEVNEAKATTRQNDDKLTKNTDQPSKVTDKVLKAEKNQEKIESKSNTSKKPAKVDKELFQEVAFIGNSLVVGLRQTCNMVGASFYACQSLDIRDAFDKKFVVGTRKNDRLTILQAISKKQYKRIYLMFGINELGWPYPEVFIQKYKEFIKKIKAIQPKAAIYVQSVLPVTKSCADLKTVFSKNNIVKCNKLLSKMSTSMNVVYLDVYSSLCNEYGYLPENCSTDGIHLRKVGYSKWLDYLKEEKIKK